MPELNAPVNCQKKPWASPRGAYVQCATFPGMDLRAQSECVWKRIRSGMYTRKSGISPIWQTMEMRTLQLEAIPTLYKVLSLLRKVLQLFSSI